VTREEIDRNREFAMCDLVEADLGGVQQPEDTASVVAKQRTLNPQKERLFSVFRGLKKVYRNLLSSMKRVYLS